MNDEAFLRAIAAGARAFADSLAASLEQQTTETGLNVVPKPGSAESMRLLLERIADVNQAGRGATAAEVSRFAKEAGMDPRGTAGYYATAKLLVKKSDGRWLTDLGKARLKRLAENTAA